MDGWMDGFPECRPYECDTTKRNIGTQPSAREVSSYSDMTGFYYI